MAPKFSHALAAGAAMLLVAALEPPVRACPLRGTDSPVASVTPRGITSLADHVEVRLAPGAEPGDLQISSPLGPPRPILRRPGAATGSAALSPAERRALEAGQIVVFTVELVVDGDPARIQSFAVGGRQGIGGLRPDHLLFVFLGLSLFGVGWLFRREPGPEHRLRLAGAGGLIAVLFLCTAPAMPWTETQELHGGAMQLEGGALQNQCTLGHEAACISPAGPSTEAQAELLERAHITSAAIRAGHALVILMLLPACIWLMVAPRSRGAQALLAAGAAPALFTALATIAYGWLLSPWRTGAGGAADLTLLACAGLVAAAAVAGLLGRRIRAASPIPAAVARDSF